MESKTNYKVLPKPLLIAILILLLFIPVSPFLVTVTNWRLLSLVREILIAAILFYGIRLRQEHKIEYIADSLERLITWLLVLALLSTLFITQDIGALAWSARYSLEPFVVFWALHPYLPDRRQINTIIVFTTIWATLLTILGVVFITAVDKETLVSWGYSAQVAVGNGQWQAAAKLPAFQTVIGSIPRLQSTLTGPIQFAGYALIFFFLLPTIKQSSIKYLYPSLYLVLLIGAISTFSRAAWLALLIIAIWKSLAHLQHKGWSKTELTGLSIVIIVAITITGGLVLSRPNAERQRELVANILNRDVGDREHVKSLTQPIKEWRQIGFWGLGFGRSGAGSIQNQNFNPEAPAARFVDNSYLRWYEELGLLGIFFFSLLVIYLIKELNEEHSVFARSLAFGGTALAITAFFTDMWLESVPVITFFTLAGLALPIHQPKTERKTTRVGGFKISLLSFNQTVNQLIKWSKRSSSHFIVTVNPEMIMAARQQRQVAQAIKKASLRTADGAGILAAAQFIHFHKSKNRFLYIISSPIIWIYTFFLLIFLPNKVSPALHRVTGSDLTQAILKAADKNQQRLALIGSKPKVITKARKNIAEGYPNLRLVWADTGPKIKADGSLQEEEARKLIAQIRHANPDFLLVAFGVPKQELFLAKYRNQLNIPVMIGVSGAFDSVLAKTVKRAPKVLQVVHLEWLWRLITQPFRFKRILTATCKFPIYITKEQYKYQKTRHKKVLTS